MVIKSRGMKWAGCLARKGEVKCLFGVETWRNVATWKNYTLKINIKLDIRVQWKGVERFYLA